MKKPKYEEKIKIDSWVCCWCGQEHSDQRDLLNLNYGDGSDTITCKKCGKENEVGYSIEFTTHPVENEEYH